MYEMELPFRTAPGFIRERLSLLLLLPAFNGIDHCIHQFQLLLCGAVQPVDLGDNRFGMYSCDPAGQFFFACVGLGGMYNHMNRCGLSNTLSPLFNGVPLSVISLCVCCCSFACPANPGGGVSIYRTPAQQCGKVPTLQGLFTL